MYNGAAAVNADGSDPLHVHAWRLKRAVDNAADVASASPEDAQEDALEAALDAFTAGDVSASESDAECASSSSDDGGRAEAVLAGLAPKESAVHGKAVGTDGGGSKTSGEPPSFSRVRIAPQPRSCATCRVAVLRAQAPAVVTCHTAVDAVDHSSRSCLPSERTGTGAGRSGFGRQHAGGAVPSLPWQPQRP